MVLVKGNYPVLCASLLILRPIRDIKVSTLTLRVYSAKYDEDWEDASNRG